ncbi:MAG: hypothetical protein ABSB74_19410 [Tepidisphaeraceae bacterium]
MKKSLSKTLDEKKVELIDLAERIRLKCRECGQVWSPNVQPGGKLPRLYWQCPNGCNAGMR